MKSVGFDPACLTYELDRARFIGRLLAQNTGLVSDRH